MWQFALLKLVQGVPERRCSVPLAGMGAGILGLPMGCSTTAAATSELGDAGNLVEAEPVVEMASQAGGWVSIPMGLGETPTASYLVAGMQLAVAKLLHYRCWQPLPLVQPVKLTVVPLGQPPLVGKAPGQVVSLKMHLVVMSHRWYLGTVQEWPCGGLTVFLILLWA